MAAKLDLQIRCLAPQLDLHLQQAGPFGLGRSLLDRELEALRLRRALLFRLRAKVQNLRQSVRFQVALVHRLAQELLADRLLAAHLAEAQDRWAARSFEAGWLAEVHL